MSGLTHLVRDKRTHTGLIHDWHPNITFYINVQSKETDLFQSFLLNDILKQWIASCLVY